MKFSDSIIKWIDEEGLIGSSPYPSKWSSGNALLETSIACLYEVLLNNQKGDVEFLHDRMMAIAMCENYNGSFDKNPGRPDEITHDDLLAIAAISRPCGMPFARLITRLGRYQGWMMSNTGLPYWDAYAKPWDKAFYLYCNGELPAWYESLAAVGAIIADALYGDPSSHRLFFLLSRSFPGMNALIDLAFQFWAARMRKRYVTVGGMMGAYYNDSCHPYVIFGRIISF